MDGRFPKIHGLSGTHFYTAWRSMKVRCTSRKTNGYENYGARGISFCKEWLDFLKFRDDMYESYLSHIEIHGSKNTQLDRIYVDKDYSKDNCKWSTIKEQGRNKRNNAYYTYKGEILALSELCEKHSIKYGTVQSRLTRGWTIDDAIEKPVAEVIFNRVVELPDPNNQIKYIGVCWIEKKKRWIAQIHVKRKHIEIGKFVTQLDAAIARDNYVIEQKLNYPLNNVVEVRIL